MSRNTDRRVGPDSKRQANHCDSREVGSLPQHAKRVAHILKHSFHRLDWHLAKPFAAASGQDLPIT